MHIIAPTAIPAEVAVTAPAGIRTYWDRLGVLRTAPANTLRVTYDPSDLTLAPYPLLEPAATQFLRYSEELDNTSAWGGSERIVTANAAAAPNGLNVADRVAATTTLGFHYLDQEPPAPATPYINGDKYTFSVFVRADQIRRIRLDFYYAIGGTGGFVAAFNLITGTIDGTAEYIAARGAKITALPGGWFRCSMVGIVEKAVEYPTKLLCRVLLLDANGNGSYIGDDAPGLFLYGLNLTAGDNLRAYIPATTTAVTRPADVIAAGAGLVYSNLLESDANDAPLWVAGAAVAKDQYRRRETTHRVYRAVQAIPTSLASTPEGDPRDAAGNPYWLEWEPTKRWAALDTTLATVSSGPNELCWVVRPSGVATALAVLNADGADVRVSEVTPAGELVYRRTKNLLLKTSRKITDFLFKPIERRRDEVFDDLPPFLGGLVCITVTKPNSIASVGDIKIGRLEEIGELLVEPEVRRLRRSIIKDDGYGRYKFNKRPSSKLLSCVVDINADRVDSVMAIIDKYTDEPCVIIGDDRWTALIILGFVQDFRLSLPGGDGATYNLQAEGLG